MLFISIFVFSLRGLLAVQEGVGLSEHKYFPVGAVQYLVSENPEGRVFTNYGWGGYMIWQNPDKKMFIDGRMPSWRNRHAPVGETKSAIDDYFGIIKGDLDLVEQLDRYGVDTVVWPPTSPENSANGLERKLLVLIFGEDALDPGVDIVEELVENGWHEYYRDDVATVLRREQ